MKHKRWEYCYLDGTLASRLDETTADLPSCDEANGLGEHGWELVCSLPAWGYNAPTLVFKREKR